MSNIIGTVVSWGSLDVEFTDKFIEEHNLSDDEVMEYARSRASDCGLDVSQDINIVIETAMQMAWDNFQEKLEDYITENDLDLNATNLEPRIYTNCLDSSYDSFVNDFDLTNFSEENIENFIEAWHESDQYA